MTSITQDLRTLLHPAALPDISASGDSNAETRRLAALARQVARGRDALFHGTQFSSLIVATGKLLFTDVGKPDVSFSRSPEVAAYWATMPRDDGEGYGAILVLDRASLKTRYKIEPQADELAWFDECEECVVQRDVEIGPHMIGLVASPRVRQSAKARASKRVCETRIERFAADCSCGARRKTCPDFLEVKRDKTLAQLRRAHPDLRSTVMELIEGSAQI